MTARLDVMEAVGVTPLQNQPGDQSALTRRELEKIVASREFVQSERLRRFLRFIVEHKLTGTTERLKESIIGVEVFGRPVTYDPKIEPIVRVEARRLRLKLERYYRSDGERDPVRIGLPKGGYEPTFEVQGTPEAVIPLDGKHRRLPLVWGVTALGMACLIAAGVWWWWWDLRKPLPVARLVPLTAYPGKQVWPAISPDGKSLAFAWDGEGGNYDIYVKLVDAGDAVRLTRDPAADLNPAWSPDGRQIAFVRMTESGKEFLVVPALGGPERRIATSAAQHLISTPDPGMITKSFGPAWSPDGASLAIVDVPTSHEPDSVYLVSIDTGQRRRVTFPVRPGEGDSSPAFSPLGDTIAFTRSHTAGSMDLYVQRLRDRGPQRLTFDNRPIPGLTWSADGRSILFSSDRKGESRLWRVPASGGAPELIGAAGANAYQPSVSHDGRLLAYAEFSTNINIWRYDVTRPEVPERLVFSKRKNHSPAYSPDGAKLVFVSNRSGESEIWISDADGKNAIALTSLGGAMPGSPRWSPDGRKIAFDSRHEGFAAIYVIDVDGGTPRRVTDRGSNCMMPGWSKDGQWIYFSSDRSGSLQIWKQPSNSGPPLQVTQSGGLDANEGTDGLYFLKNKSHGIWRTALQGGEEALVPGLGAVETSRHLAFNSRGIYFANLNAARREISFFDFSSRQIKPVFNVERPLLFGTPGLTVSPDGRWIAVAEMDQAVSAIMALELVPNRLREIAH